jgi:RNA polymerase sigma-70 factor (ECF subfamily)
LAIILKKISAADFQLIEMRFFEKRPFSEIGELLDITENNAKVKAYRVIQKLKNLFKAEAV